MTDSSPTCMSDYSFTYFIISLFVTLGLYIFTAAQITINQKTMKTIIKDEIIQILKIYEKIDFDLNKFDGNKDSDLIKAQELTTYFERKYPTLTMIRMNIKNHLAHVLNTKYGIIRDIKYKKSINSILVNLDSILETCYDPKLPSDAQLSLWGDKKNMIEKLIIDSISISDDNNLTKK